MGAFNVAAGFTMHLFGIIKKQLNIVLILLCYLCWPLCWIFCGVDSSAIHQILLKYVDTSHEMALCLTLLFSLDCIERG